MTKVKIEFFKDGGKWYTSFNYESNLEVWDIDGILSEVRLNKMFIKTMNFTLEVEKGESWNKYLFIANK